VSFRPSVQLGFLLPLVLLILGALEVGLRLLPAATFSYRAWEPVSVDAVPGAPFGALHAYSNPATYGDLAALGNLPKAREYRAERFTTDRLGYRNPPALAEGAPIDAILLGTSFSVGAGMSDDDTLASQLSQRSGLTVYNGSGAEYLQATAVARAAALAGSLNLRGRTVVYEHLERHDPPPQWPVDVQARQAVAMTAPCTGQDPSALVMARCRLVGLVGPTLVSPLHIWTAQAFRHLEDDRILPNASASLVTPLRLRNGHSMLFFPLDLESTGRPRDVGGTAEHFVWLQSELARLDLQLLVVLVPDKSTVYGPLLARPLPDSEKAAHFLDSLESGLGRRGITAIDLTPALRHAAETGFPRNEYVFWSDDTHWSPRGIAVAADTILSRWQRR
jgi:hypothetical protein